MYDSNDTIAAISTPLGEGGIGIVRLSGPNSLRILEALFAPSDGARGRQFRSHELRHGWVRDPDTGDLVDEVLATFMRGPRTYTREHVVEINCHGGPLPVRRVLGLCLGHGARMAEPGEMTLRAFLNGRLDLAQAEAVADLIKARTGAAMRAAAGQLSGNLSGRISAIRSSLLAALAHLEASLDFAEEDIPPVGLAEALELATTEVKSLLANGKVGIIYRDGARVAIVGKPNVGKSSLLNALVQSDRAIVTDIPGTTRDTLEEGIDLGGVPVYLVDTAGITETADTVERLGIERSRLAIERANLSILVVDGSRPLTSEDEAVAGIIPRVPVAGGVPGVVVVNKADLEERFCDGEASSLLPGARVVRTSTVTGQGLQELQDSLLEGVLGGRTLVGQDAVVTNNRHYSLLEEAGAAIESASEGLRSLRPDDLIAIDVRGAIDALGMITGETVGDDILEQIFSRSAWESSAENTAAVELIELKDGVQIKVHVMPRASRTAVGGVHGDAVRVYLTAPPVEGAANEALVKVLADFFGLKKRQVHIVSGQSDRTKRLRLEGIELSAVRETLARLG